MEDDTAVNPLVQYAYFLSDKEEYKAFEILFDAGTPIAYLGDRTYAVSEENCRAFRERGIQYRIVGATPAAAP